MPKVTRKRAVILYENGETETVNFGKPAVVYELSMLGFEGDENPVEFGYICCWIASGRPGMNGAPLTRESALAYMRKWLDTVDDIDWQEQDASGPPTKQPRTRRGSAA